MTDRDKLKELLEQWEVTYLVEEDSIILQASTSPIAGYNGFVTYFTFNKEVKFEHIGIWE